jgi:hypothetical protein
VLRKDKLNYHLLASGTGFSWSAKSIWLLISSTPNPNVGDYEGQTGLSPPAAYPDKPWGRVATKGNFKPRHHVYTIYHYF